MCAKIFIDCSGDGDLAAWAGALFEVGVITPAACCILLRCSVSTASIRKGRRGLASDPGADGKGRLPARIASRARLQIVRPQRSQPNGGLTLPSLRARRWQGDHPVRARRSHAWRDRRASPGHRGVRIPAYGARLREVLHRRPAAAARHPRNASRGRRLYALGEGRAWLRLV